MSNKKAAVEKLYDELTKFATSPEDVARSLQQRGIRGKRGDSCHCPLANAVEAVTNDKARPNVTGQSTSVVGAGIIDMATRYPLLAKFVDQFDGGKFDYLVDTGA